MGNPTSYLGHTLTWEKGRQLKRFVKSDNTVIDYTYNANGIRTSKTICDVTHTYTLDGTKILREVWCDNTLIPLYDSEDNVCGIIYNDTPYYFLKNLQGDVIAIVNKDAETVARYSYDAWGKVTNSGNITYNGKLHSTDGKIYIGGVIGEYKLVTKNNSAWTGEVAFTGNISCTGTHGATTYVGGIFGDAFDDFRSGNTLFLDG
mgnify:CR=1 FL=1